MQEGRSTRLRQGERPLLQGRDPDGRQRHHEVLGDGGAAEVGELGRGGRILQAVSLSRWKSSQVCKLVGDVKCLFDTLGTVT